MSQASANGNALVRATVRLPPSLIWNADIVTERAVQLSGAVTLTVGGLTLAGTVYRGEVYQGSAAYRIEGGRGGWRLPVRARTHQDDSGVRLSRVLASVLSDMPEANRETLTVPAEADRILGTTWLRSAGLARVSLGLLRVPWYVRNDGSTFAGARPSGAVVDAQAEVLHYDPEHRRVIVGTEKPEAWAPGLTFTSTRLASPILLREVTIRVEKGKMRVEVTG